MVVTYIELNMGSILGNEKTNFQHMHVNKIIKQSPKNHQSHSQNESTVYHMYKSCTYIWSEMQKDTCHRQPFKLNVHTTLYTFFTKLVC